VPRCLSDKKLNNWIIGNRQRPLITECFAQLGKVGLAAPNLAELGG